jgi:hypothetical protein
MKRILILLLLSAIVVSIAAPSFSATRKQKGFLFSTSIGLGVGFPLAPDEFETNWDPSFGAILDVAVQRSLLEASVSFDYNFFLSNGINPDDANILTIFLNLKIKPIAKTSVRPYILIGGGYYRFWIVDANITDNTTGYQAGAGVELDISKTQRLFIDAKQVIGRTRSPYVNSTGENTSHIAVRIGLTFVF